MALTPISLFQAQGSGIAQFLQGGQNALASALNNVIQVGRDTANKQFAQERDFLGERQRVEALAQRRGEMAQQQSNIDRSFARGVLESDRQFADVNADQARQEQRQMAMDLFNVNESNREYGLRQSEANRVAAERERADQFSADILAQPPSAAAPSRMSADFLYGPVTGTPAPAPMTGTTPEPTAAASSAEARLAQAKIRMEAARGRDAQAYTAAAQEAATIEGELRRSGAVTEGMTPTQLMSRERLDIAKEDRTLRQQEEAAKKAEEVAEKTRKEATSAVELLVQSDTSAFPPAGSYVPRDLPKADREAALAEAQATDANRPAVELQAALDSPTADDYVAKMVAPARWDGDKWVAKTPEEIKTEIAKLPKNVVNKRKKLWSEARKTGRAGAGAGTPAATAPSGSTDWLDTALKGL
jgi:hypothetical protein